jgi:hypothetical protein
MTGTTQNGIRYPNDPTIYADIIQFFTDMADDIDKKFIPKTGNQSVSGVLTAKSFASTNGGTTQSATVLQSGPVPSSATIIYDDNVKLDGAPGRRFWIAPAHATDFAIQTRNSGELLNQISMKASTVDVTGAVTIHGTLNVLGMSTVTNKVEINCTLTRNTTSWTPIPGSPGFTFVAPPSNKVIIGFGAMLPTYNTTCMLSYTIKEGATLGQGVEVLPVRHADLGATQTPRQAVAANGVTSTGVQYYSVYTAWLQGSLNAGQTYNIVPYYINNNTANPEGNLTMYRHYFIVQPDL